MTEKLDQVFSSNFFQFLVGCLSKWKI